MTAELKWTRDGDLHFADIDADHRVYVTEYYFPTGAVFHAMLGYSGLGSDVSLEGAKWIAETHPKVTKLLSARAAA